MKYREEAHKHFAPLLPFPPASVLSTKKCSVLVEAWNSILLEASKVHTCTELPPPPSRQDGVSKARY